MFCPKCGNLMVGDKKKKGYLFCRKCEHRVKSREKVEITEAIHEKKKDIVVMGKDEGVAELPTTTIMCPKCENMEAYWWMQQTRAADEPPTIFYRCKKCSFSWRSYG